jgi:D-amino peptidase
VNLARSEGAAGGTYHGPFGKIACVKVFISFDMEGVAGIVDWSQCRGPGQPYEEGRRLLTGEVNAAIDGALAGGATEIVCNDSHGTMNNLDPAALHGQASYVSGRHKPLYMMQGLDATADVVFMVGYHGSISGESSVLSHTYNPSVVSHAELNGTRVGESGINALVALACQAPVGLITGDQRTIGEAGPFLPDAERVVVKESFTRFGVSNLHPEVARGLIADGARRAVERVAARPAEVWEIAAGGAPTDADEPSVLRLPAISLPAVLEVHMQTADMAEVGTWVRGVERTGVRAVSIRGEDPLAVFRSFVALTYITRVSEGRLGRRAGGGAGNQVAAPAGERRVPVEGKGHAAVGRFRVPVLRGHPPHDLELDAVGVLGVQRLGHAVVALPDQRSGLGQLSPGLDQIAERADLPGQVVQPDLRPARRAALRGLKVWADLEQAEVVVVGRARGAQERGAAGDLQADLEAQGGAVEVDGALETVYVQDGVVEAADGHLRFLPWVAWENKASCCSVQFRAKRCHSRKAAGNGTRAVPGGPGLRAGASGAARAAGGGSRGTGGAATHRA